MTATYIGPKGKRYRLTDDDMLWAARMIVGEGGESCGRQKAAAYLWAMMNRFMAYRKWRSFKGLLRKFSQPINPIWRRTGKMCRPGGKYHGTKHCSEPRLNRRERISSLAWEDIPVPIRYFVREFAGGILPKPDRWAGKGAINNWGASTITNVVNGERLPLPQAYPSGLGMGGEWFFQDPGSASPQIEVTGTDGPLPTGPRPIGFLGAVTTVALGVALGTGTWLAYQWYFKKSKNT